MHIEPGYVASAKIVVANIATVALLGSQSIRLLKKPQLIVRSLIAGVFFTLFMQVFHLQVGPSELHFLGAMPIYLALGFVPALFGFAIGLAAQGLLFEPTDLLHLGVNTLSLAVPLMVVHATLGKRLQAAGERLDGGDHAGAGRRGGDHGEAPRLAVGGRGRGHRGREHALEGRARDRRGGVLADAAAGRQVGQHGFGGDCHASLKPPSTFQIWPVT